MPAQAKPKPLDYLAFALISVIVFSAAWGIAVADWVPRLDLIGLTTVVALCIGALIATRPWRQRFAVAVMAAYGVLWITLVAISYIPDKVYGFTWLDTLRHLLVRLGEHIYIWGEAALSGGVGTDNTIFLVILSAIFWLVAYVAVRCTVLRRHLWGAVAPAGIILLVNMYYYGGERSLLPLLVIYLSAVLLYMARLYTLNQEQQWQFQRVRFNPEIKRDFLQLGGVIAIAAVLFGTIAPTFAGAPQISGLWREISGPIRWMEDTFSRLFTGLQPHGLPYANPFGRTLALAGQRNLGDELVLEVRAPEASYWQAVVYDHYEDGAFQSSSTQSLDVAAGQAIVPSLGSSRSLITQTFYVFFPNSTQIFAAPQPVSINRPSKAENFSGNETALWSMLTPLSDGESYQAVSAVSQASIKQLRAAGQRYPAEIRERYLQLPDSLPGRVRTLARDIVTKAGATSPYDQAAALELWLRVNIKYNDQINAPAPGRDGVDYMLFETEEGYCDYYASAFAVMARSLGIPARIVTGFAQGQFDSQRGLYVVRQYHAHTWAEIYFPNYGWIQFEPTASQPSIVRPEDVNSAGNTNASDREQNDRGRFGGREPEDQEFDPNTGPASMLGTLEAVVTPPLALPTPVLVAAALAGLALLMASGGFLAIGWYEQRGVPKQASGGAWAYARLSRMTRWLRLNLSTADTPYEQAKTIGAAVPKRRDEIDQLADFYVRERYGCAEIDAAETRSIWQRIHWSLWQTGVKRRLPHILSLPKQAWRRIRR
ncbi:MAG: transglutaminase domain-containing protein [Caldilineaceae bacterium]|nr:transglutaminase domain-containing protein [Caldilineaceae bacterium]